MGPEGQGRRMANEAAYDEIREARGGEQGLKTHQGALRIDRETAAEREPPRAPTAEPQPSGRDWRHHHHLEVLQAAVTRPSIVFTEGGKEGWLGGDILEQNAAIIRDISAVYTPLG